ncbi:MAG TPA: hypothetical protein VIR78_04550 [Malonomonas sp.]
MTGPVAAELPKITLTDHAFFQLLQEDRSFRQALVLDLPTALEPFSISARSRQWIGSLVAQLDDLTDILVATWVENVELKSFLADHRSRRELLFAPSQAGLSSKLSEAAASELQDLTEKANILAEGLLAWR